MVVIINDDRVTDVEAYLPVAKAFAADAVANDEDCISMEVLVDPKTPGRVLYLSHFESEEHFRKHGIEMGFATEEEYQKAASDVANNPDALHKLEKDDKDDVYYLEETNEFVVVSVDGFIRTYFCPDSGKKYFDKQ